MSARSLSKLDRISLVSVTGRLIIYLFHEVWIVGRL